MKRSLLVLVLGLAVLSGCPKKKQPSVEFESASRDFSRLYAEELDDAFLDPQISEIEARLEQVPEDSLDAQAAQALLTRIREGRARMEGELAEREELAREAAEPLPYTGPIEEREEDAPAPDAGTPAQAAHPATGMAEAELTSRFGDCFVKGEPLEITGRGQRETYDLRPTDACRAAHPGFDAKLVVIEAGKVVGMVAKSGVQTRVTQTTRTVIVDAGTRDAGVAPPAADAGR